MSKLRLLLLGPPLVERDGQPLDIGRRKAVALLAYLAVAGHGHSRDSLAALLWPDSDQSSARGNLRRTLSALNTALDGHWLDADREIIDLDRAAGLWIDVEEFRRLLSASRTHGHATLDTCSDCLASLAEAAALYRDDFMAGFTLRDSPEFDDWQFFQAESLRRELAGALERLARAHGELGEYEPAVNYARRWLRLDPLREEAHRQLMQLYARTDQRPAALRQYKECVRVLEEELGVSPSEETRVLYEQIQVSGIRDQGSGLRDGRPPAPSPQPSNHPTIQLANLPTPSHPFVGREGELVQLRGHLGAALAGQGCVVFVAGEAGSGKTALVHEFARRAQADVPDLVVAVGNCNAYTGLGDPYLPFREILGLLTGETGTQWSQGVITEENAGRLLGLLPTALGTLVDVAPDLIDSLVPAGALAARALALTGDRPDWLHRFKRVVEHRAEGYAPGSMAQADLFEQYAYLLRALAQHQPLLLVVDDAQWADAASISLLFHLSRRLAGGRILLVVTYRPDEVALGRGEERHPLEPVINELKRAYGDVWVDLEPVLGRGFIDALLDAEPNYLGEAFRAGLYRQTGGHPLFTIELLRAMQERGDLVRDAGGRWLEGPDLDWETLPARVEAVIQERIGRLDGALREMLAVASIEGETFTAQVVARVQGIGERSLLSALSRELERRHHLVQALGETRVNGYFLSRYRFNHTMFQQYLYHTFSAGERRLLHGEIAAALEALYQDEAEEMTVQLARHYAEAGQVKQAVDYLLRAGDRARYLYAHQEAVDFYEQALAMLKEQGDYERAARTLMKLGLTYHLAFNFPRARHAYQEGFALWQRAGADHPASVLAPPAPHPLRLVWFDPPTLDPTLSGDDTSGTVITQLFSGLVAFNQDLDVVPEAARSWDVLEGGRRYVFHLRGDMRWSDGEPVTAEDFIYAWRRTLDPATGSPNASYLFDIFGARAYHQGDLADPDQLGVHAPDPLTLVLELEGPTSYLPQLLAQHPLYPVPRHIVEVHGRAWTKREHLVTNGPFRLQDWQPGESMVLERSPVYSGSFPGNVEQIVLTLNAPTTEEQLALYEADRLDLTVLLPSPEAERLRLRRAEEYFTGPALYTQYLGFNVRHPPLDDPRVRRALALAIDKEQLASLRGQGYFFPATGGFIPPEMPGHSPGIGLPYDPEAAKALLAEAGYPGGWRFPKLQGLANSPNKILAGDTMAAHWRENLGIEVEWQARDWHRLLKQLDREPPPMFVMGWRADYPDPDNMLRVGSHQIWVGWHDPAYADLVERARRVSDPAERLALYRQADSVLVEAAAIVPIAYGRHHLLVKPWIKRLSASAIAWPYWKEVVIEPH